MDSSEDLLKTIKIDPDKGFKVLVESYQERLYWHIRRIVIVHNDADDALQNTFIKAFQNIHKFEAKASLYTWLYRIATNEAINLRKRNQRKRSISINDEQGSLSERLISDPFFDGDLITAQLHEYVDTLPERQKMVFNLRYFEEMPYKEIARILQLTEGALKASYHHAAKKIEMLFKNQKQYL